MDAIERAIRRGDPAITKAFVCTLTDTEFAQLIQDMKGVNDWGADYLKLMRLVGRRDLQLDIKA